MKLFSNNITPQSSVQTDMRIYERLRNQEKIKNSVVNNRNMFYSVEKTSVPKISLKEFYSDNTLEKFVTCINVDSDSLYLGSSFSSLFSECLNEEGITCGNTTKAKRKNDNTQEYSLYNDLIGYSKQKISSNVLPPLSTLSTSKYSKQTLTITSSQKSFVSPSIGRLHRQKNFPTMTIERFKASMLSLAMKSSNIFFVTISFGNFGKTEQEIGFSEFEISKTQKTILMHKLYILKIFRKSTDCDSIHKKVFSRFFEKYPQTSKILLKLLNKYDTYKTFLIKIGFRLQKTIRVDSLEVDLMVLTKDNLK